MAFGSKVLALPTEKNKPSNDIMDYSICLYGERKIGKTTLIGEFEDVFFMSFEPGAKSTEAYVVNIESWEQFLQYVELLQTGTGKYRMHVIDTGGVAYEMAMQYACKKFGFEHPGGQNDYGQSWSKVRKEFQAPIRWLLNCGTPLVVIGHEQEKEIETRSGRKFVKMRPNFPGQADEFYTSQLDNVFYYFYEDNQRWLQIEGDEYITAGHRIRGHFFTPAGERVFKVPMGISEKEAFKNLMTAFNNKQKETFAPEKKDETKPTTPAVSTGGTAPATGFKKKFSK